MYVRLRANKRMIIIFITQYVTKVYGIQSKRLICFHIGAQLMVENKQSQQRTDILSLHYQFFRISIENR